MLTHHYSDQKITVEGSNELVFNVIYEPDKCQRYFLAPAHKKLWTIDTKSFKNIKAAEYWALAMALEYDVVA